MAPATARLVSPAKLKRGQFFLHWDGIAAPALERVRDIEVLPHGMVRILPFSGGWMLLNQRNLQVAYSGLRCEVAGVLFDRIHAALPWEDNTPLSTLVACYQRLTENCGLSAFPREVRGLIKRMEVAL